MEIKRHYQPRRVKKYEARWYVEGRLKCRFFATEVERERFIEEFQEQLVENGTGLLMGFDPLKMRRWQEASRLAPEADPVEVMRFWVAMNRPKLIPKPFAEAVPAYLQFLEAMERDADYRRHVAVHLEDFTAAVGCRPVHEVTPQMVADYIYRLPYKPVTKRHYKRSLGGAFAWWMEQGWAMENPARKVRTPEVLTPEPGILSVADMTALFRANEKVDPEVCGLLALGAFAGMRSSAIAKIDYSEIDFVQRGIHTPAEKTKKRRRQWIEGLPENLWKWLERTPPQAFAMSHRQFMHRRSEALKRAGLLIEADDIARENRKREERGEPCVTWKPKAPPKNCFRHSFATYHVALHRDAGKTALIMSHRHQQVLWQHYLGVANKEQAERYFKIVPTSKARRR
jgi:integrase